MINVSQGYKSNIYKDETKTYCTASFGLFDLNGKSQAKVTASSEYFGSGKLTEFTSSIAPTTWTAVSAPYRYEATNIIGTWGIYTNRGGSTYNVSNAFDDSPTTYYKVTLEPDMERYLQITLPHRIIPRVIKVRHKVNRSMTQANNYFGIKLYGRINNEWVFIQDIILPSPYEAEIFTSTVNLTSNAKYDGFRLMYKNKSANNNNDYYVYSFEIENGLIERNAPENTIDGVIGDTSSVWISNEVSDSSGYFSSNPWIQYEWDSPHSSVGLQLYFNTNIRSATITYYDDTDTVIDTYSISGNDNNFTIENVVNNYTKIKIEFIRTGLSNARIRMQEINFGIEYTYREDIISIEVEELLDNKMQELASSKATLRLNNLDRKFNQYDPDSIFNYLVEGQRVQINSWAEFNGTQEVVPLGTFYLSSWKIDSEFTITFEFNDILYRFANREFLRSKFYQDGQASVTAKQYLTDMFDSFNTTYGEQIQYVIDDDLSSISLRGYLEPQDYRTALQKVCIATCSVAYSNRDGKVEIKTLNTSSPVDVIDFSRKAYSNTETLESFSSVTINSIPSYSYSGDVEQLYSGSINGDKTITFSEPKGKVTVTGADSYEIYANCVDVHNLSAQTVTISGAPIETGLKEPVKVTSSQISNVTALETTLQDILLITNETIATRVANWLLSEFQKNMKTEFKWLSNPAIEIGDIVVIQVDTNSYKMAQIIKNKFSFKGSLSETSELLICGDVQLQTWDGLTETYWNEIDNKLWTEVAYVTANN